MNGGSANVADLGRASICEEEDGDGGLLERQQQAYVRVERRKYYVALLTHVVDKTQDGVDIAVELHGVAVHAFQFGLEQHWVLHLDVEADILRNLEEHLLKGGERRLDKFATDVALEALRLEIASVLHTFAHIGALVHVGTTKGIGALRAENRPLVTTAATAVAVVVAVSTRCPGWLAGSVARCAFVYMEELLEGQAVYRDIGTGLADEEVVVDHRDVVFRELNVKLHV